MLAIASKRTPLDITLMERQQTQAHKKHENTRIVQWLVSLSHPSTQGSLSHPSTQGSIPSKILPMCAEGVAHHCACASSSLSSM